MLEVDVGVSMVLIEIVVVEAFAVSDIVGVQNLVEE